MMSEDCWSKREKRLQGPGLHHKVSKNWLSENVSLGSQDKSQQVALAVWEQGIFLVLKLLRDIPDWTLHRNGHFQKCQSCWSLPALFDPFPCRTILVMVSRYIEMAPYDANDPFQSLRIVPPCRKKQKQLPYSKTFKSIFIAVNWVTTSDGSNGVQGASYNSVPSYSAKRIPFYLRWHHCHALNKNI